MYLYDTANEFYTLKHVFEMSFFFEIVISCESSKIELYYAHYLGLKKLLDAKILSEKIRTPSLVRPSSIADLSIRSCSQKMLLNFIPISFTNFMYCVIQLHTPVHCASNLFTFALKDTGDFFRERNKNYIPTPDFKI